MRQFLYLEDEQKFFGSNPIFSGRISKVIFFGLLLVFHTHTFLKIRARLRFIG